MTRPVKTVLTTTVSLLLLICGFAALAGKWPWQRRIGKDVEIHHKRQHENRVLPEMWPDEPATPATIDEAGFVTALRQICGEKRLGPERGQKFGAAILLYARLFKVDPFLVGGLIYDQSRCLPKQPDNENRLYGLSRIDVAMHAPHVRDKKYNYWIRENNQWKKKSLAVEKYPFNLWKAANPISNIYWTAAILRVFKEQHADLADAFADGFEHAQYRHYVSHWFFGDNVQSSEPEDRVLTARRRLLQYYHGGQITAAGEYGGLPLVSPLDGVPRMVLDEFGRWRGKRRTGYKHNGVDLVAELDEPIRAVADGKTVFVGVDMPNAGSKRLTGEEATRFDPRKMGAGGRYVAINHGNGLRSYYMHMDTIVVDDWSDVKAGDIIGTVGRSGSTESGPHLHLEFRTDSGREDPAQFMQKVLIDPKRWRDMRRSVASQ
ncbi:MAG: M23 family metallopeptidase [Deltaproteobacteria bacterium]|nr:M23 family metallopeptidase [Deltaproteobacteria bacterium]